MYKLIQKNQKKFLAVFVVLLMIVFLLPSGTKNSLGRGGDLVVGTAFGQSLYGRDLHEAKSDLDLLRHYQFGPLLNLGHGYALRQFLEHDELYVLLQREALQQGIVITDAQAQSVADQKDQHWDQLPRDTIDELVPAVRRFLLVQAGFERVSSGVKVSQPLMRYLLSEDFQQTNIDLVEFKGEDFANQVPAPTAEQVRERYEKYADVLPQPADFFSGRSATPGYKVPDRVKLQYLELPHDAVVRSVVNGLGKDELYDLDIEAIRFYGSHLSDPAFQTPATAPATGPSTAPATAPAPLPAPPATLPAGPTTRPFDEVKAALRIRLVNDKALSTSDLVNSIRGRVSTQEDKLRGELHDELADAWKQWSAAHPDGQAPPETVEPAGPPSPTTGPTTLPVGVYPNLKFLQALADQFESRHQVRPMVTSLGKDWLTHEELEKLEPIAGASADGTLFASYVIRSVAPPPTTSPTTAPTTAPTAEPATGPATDPTTALAGNPATGPTAAPAGSPATGPTTLAAATGPAGPATRPAAGRLRLFEPSGILKDHSDNAFVLRVTAFDPAHRPTLEEAWSQVVKDLRAAAGLEKAREQAQEVLALASRHNFASAAKSFEHPVLHAGPFSPKLAHDDLEGNARFQYMFQPLRGYDPQEPGDRLVFLKGIKPLLQKTAPDNPHPSALIELPGERKVLAAQVVGNSLPWPAEDTFIREIGLSRLAAMSLESGSPTLSVESLLGQAGPAANSLIARWFNYNDAVARTKYVPTREKGSKSGT